MKNALTERSSVCNFSPHKAKIADIMMLRKKINFPLNFFPKSFTTCAGILLLMGMAGVVGCKTINPGEVGFVVHK
ncbi:MAG TPA: hypothetical protein VNV35_19630, partial [Puia sp.]|nr:hypothetical protein [Puia sp.]